MSSNQATGTPSATNSLSRDQLSKLIENLGQYFSDQELRTLCYSMGVDYDDLPGQGKSDKAREFVAYLERRGRVPELVRICRNLRGNANWEYRPERRFRAGAVLYANVTGFSNLARIDQNRVVGFVKQEIDKFLAIEYTAWLDFRGGDFLLFLEHEPDELQADTLARVSLFGLQLQLRVQALEHSFRIGIAVDWEDDAQQYYIESRDYRIGQHFDTAQLLVSFSDSGHFFMSTDVYDRLHRDLLGGAQAGFDELLRAMQSHLGQRSPDYGSLFLRGADFDIECTKFTFHDQHKRQHDFYNLYAKSRVSQFSIGEQTAPSHRVAIEYRDKRDIEDRQHVFIQRLVEADEVTIIALTHENTAKYLLEAIEQREREGQGFWNQLRIVFPSQTILEKVIDQHPTTEERLNRWNAGKRSVFQFLLSVGSECVGRWEFLEFDGNLPFWGNWFTGKKNSSVRVAPILPGCDQKKTYYTEFFKGMQAYTDLEEAFNFICNRSLRIAEWDVYGQWKEDAFHYRGIVNRIRWGEMAKTRAYCFPVVLIMLYSDMGTGVMSILQERTKYNASIDIGRFSNISGRVTDMDIYNAKKLPPYIDLQVELDDVATIALNERAGLNPDDPLPPGTWEEAAIREIQEELGLAVTRDRLENEALYYLERDDGNLLFKIFSLKLRRGARVDELQAIRNSRPSISLSEFNLSRLQRYHDEQRFNRLLQNRFTQVFLPIFEKLGIK